MAATGMAESEHALVGTWKLVSAKNTTEKGEVEDQMGPNPIGFLTYTTDERMSVVMARSGRKPFSTFPPPPEETAEAFSANAFAAYAGSFTLDGDKVIHHVEVCAIENFANTDQVRSMTLQGDRLTLRAEGVLQGVTYRAELVWERLKPSKP